MIVLRRIAMAIAIASIWDPGVAVPRRQHPAIDVLSSPDATSGRIAERLRRDLTSVGFGVNGGRSPVARVAVADRPPVGLPADVPLFAVDTSDRGSPSIRITHVWSSQDRAPGQSARLLVSVDGIGVKGETVELRAEDSGVTVASARHQWQAANESWSTALDYVPPAPTATTIRVRAVRLRGQTPNAQTRGQTPGDSVQDVRLPALRPPFRVLAYDTTVSWPATFVRRALEGQGAFALSVLERASPATATRAGTPPRSLSAADLASYDLVIVGSPEDLSSADIETLRRFVDERGGAIALVPSRRSTGGYTALLGTTTFEPRAVEEPVTLAGPDGVALHASEMLVARAVPTAARALATVSASSDPVVFTLRRGAGVILFSGALDAWRYRAMEHEAFARFWRTALAEAALSVASRLKLDVYPGVVRPDEQVRIRARLGPMELAAGGDGAVTTAIAARVVGPKQHVDEMVRLWPSVEPGTFEGAWTAQTSGEYAMSASSGSLRADAIVEVDDHTTSLAAVDPDGLRLFAIASGGAVHTPDRVGDLVSALEERFPARQVSTRRHPMRSPWWIVPFALALCLEWMWRRVHGER